MVGELRALPLEMRSHPTEFRFRLKNTHRIEQLKLNDKFVKAVAQGEYVVSLPPQLQPSEQTPAFPLIKYIATSRWRPVPVFVDASVERCSATEATLHAAIETNPQLKMPLQNVVVTVTPGPAAKACVVSPPGAWESEHHRVQWTLPQLQSKEKPVLCSAKLSGDEDIASVASQQPVHVQFGCDGVTISGIELEVEMGSSGQPVARLSRRFVSGDYKVRARCLAPAPMPVAT